MGNNPLKMGMGVVGMMEKRQRLGEKGDLGLTMR